eukprot:COSAG05_NODE_153_length_15894_cov_27.910415_13_plen_325_part_00
MKITLVQAKAAPTLVRAVDCEALQTDQLLADEVLAKQLYASDRRGSRARRVDMVAEFAAENARTQLAPSPKAADSAKKAAKRKDPAPVKVGGSSKQKAAPSLIGNKRRVQSVCQFSEGDEVALEDGRRGIVASKSNGYVLVEVDGVPANFRAAQLQAISRGRAIGRSQPKGGKARRRADTPQNTPKVPPCKKRRKPGRGTGHKRSLGAGAAASPAGEEDLEHEHEEALARFGPMLIGEKPKLAAGVWAEYSDDDETKLWAEQNRGKAFQVKVMGFTASLVHRPFTVQYTGEPDFNLPLGPIWIGLSLARQKVSPPPAAGRIHIC